MSRFTVSPLARADLDSIWDYIAAQNLRAADRLLARIRAKFQLIARSPLLGESCEELAPNLRRSTVGNYVIYYEPSRDSIRIVRVLHGARDIQDLF